jgi:hypothetical protein
MSIHWLCRWSVAIGGVAVACSVPVVVRVLDRYADAGTVNWNELFQAVVVPALIFCIMRFGERRMEGTAEGVDAEACPADQKPGEPPVPPSSIVS